MEIIKMLVLMLVLGIITIVDIKFYKIPNLLILIGMAIGLYFSLGRLKQSLITMVVVFLVFYPFYILKGLGAGDIKLIMMLSFYFEKEKLIQIVVITFIVGAGISVIKIIFVKAARERAKYGFRYLRKCIVTKAVDPYQCNKTNKKTFVRMSLPISIATLLGGIIL